MDSEYLINSKQPPYMSIIYVLSSIIVSSVTATACLYDEWYYLYIMHSLQLLFYSESIAIVLTKLYYMDVLLH